MRVDAHVHVWRLARSDYGWLAPTAKLAPIYRDFDLDDVRPCLRGAGGRAIVLVQAAPTVGETRFLLDTARGSGGLVRGVVGWADLASPEAPDTLGELSADPLLRGVRPMLQDLDDPRWITRVQVAPALRALSRLDLRLDALVTPRELPALLEMLRQHSDLTVVVDHCAKPDIAHTLWQPWADDIAAIAATTSAYCKLSGLVTEARRGWTVEDLRPYVEHVLASFGTDRVIWGSDWPVLTLAGSYADWLAASEALLGGLSQCEREGIFGGNAQRFYGLE